MACLFCGNEGSDTPCSRPACIENDRIYEREMHAEWGRRRRAAVRAAICDWCCDGNYGLGIVGRSFYVMKALICILLRRSGGSRREVEVAVWDIRAAMGEWSGSEWTSLHVGYGVFRNWHYSIDDDTSY